MIRFRFPALLCLIFALSLAGCAHSGPQADYSASSNVPAEIQKLDADMGTLSQQGYEVLSPEHFKAAREKLADAKAAQEKGN